MIRFFQTPLKTVIATEVDHKLSEQEIKELNWLYGEATMLEADTLEGFFVGPRREMVTPWSTNAVEITQNMTRCCNVCTTALTRISSQSISNQNPLSMWTIWRNTTNRKASH